MKNVISMSLVSQSIAQKLLLVQLLVVITNELLFNLRDPFWGVSAINEGLAVSLPNVLFVMFVWRHQAYTPTKSQVVQVSTFGETFKAPVTLMLPVVVLAVLKAIFLPLIVTWVLVLVVQVLAPTVINNKRQKTS